MNHYTEKRGANHSFHLVLTLLTCGLWAITGWPIAAIMGRKRTVRGPQPPQYYPQYGPPPGQYPPPGYGPQQPPQGPHGAPPRR